MIVTRSNTLKAFYFFKRISQLLKLTEKNVDSENLNLCQCGCGQPCENKFILGHNRKGISKYNDFDEYVECLCGCGETIPKRDKFRRLRLWKKGHWNKLKDMSGKNNPSWKGGSYISGNGYRMIYIGNGKYEYEHRIVMKKFLGRELTETEVIHHKDKNTLNNSIENLMLFENNGLHLKFEFSGVKKRV